LKPDFGMPLLSLLELGVHIGSFSLIMHSYVLTSC
jgi:hypothetical protein